MSQNDPNGPKSGTKMGQKGPYYRESIGFCKRRLKPLELGLVVDDNFDRVATKIPAPNPIVNLSDSSARQFTYPFPPRLHAPRRTPL